MISAGMPPEAITGILALMQLQNAYARTGQGWDEYAAARTELARRMGGSPPDSFPARPDDRHFQMMRRLYFYDPARALR